MNKKVVFIILVVIVLLMAGFFRLYNINYTEFKVDQALNMYLTLDIIENGPIPEHVLLSSVKTYNPPLFHYLLIIPVLISKNPIVASGFIAVLNILAIIIAFFFLKSIFNKRIALITCAVWAVNPWAIMYSRHIWHQNVLPLFIILFFGAILKLVINRKITPDNTSKQATGHGWWLILASASLACLLQIHLSTLGLIFIWLGVVIWQRKKIKFVYLALSILIILILFLPYFIYEIQHDFYNFNKILEVSKSPSQQHWTALVIPFKLATTQGLDKYLGDSLPGILNKITWGNVIDWMQVLILLAGIVYIVQRIINQIIKTKKVYLDLENKKYLVLVLWLILPVTFLFFNKSPIHDHYFILLFPVQFIIIAIVLDKIFKLPLNKNAINKVIKIISGLVLITIFMYPALYSLTWLKMTGDKQCMNGIYGKPYKYQENSIRELLGNGENDLGVIYHTTCNCPFCFPVQIEYIYEYLNGKL